MHTLSSVNALAILERIADAFFALDNEWRFTYVNAQAEKLWRRSANDLVGKVIWEEFPHLEAGPYGPVYRKAAIERVPASITALSPNTGRWYELSVFPDVGGLSAYFRDATETKLTELNLARLAAETERERRIYQTVLSSTADFNYVFDLDGRFTYINDALLTLWQKTSAEAIGLNFFELEYPPDLAARLQNQIQQVIVTGQPVRDETPYTSAFGTRAYEYIFVPVVNADGRIEAVAGSTRDITDRKESELALRDADRRKDEFLATLAHELRNPLAPIRNALQVCRLAKGNAAVVEQSYDMMERQLGSMVRLIDDLLDLSRVTLGKVEMRKSSVDLALVLQSAVETAKPHIEKLGHELTFSASDKVLHVEADTTRLSQVFSNLLTNAAKFTPRGGRIWLTVSCDDENAIVSVRDNGIGIEAPMLSQVFEMFTQVHDSRLQSQGGLGIGLTLAQRLVLLHGGTIEARSDGASQGSEFIVQLPLVEQSTGRASHATPQSSANATTPSQRILIVDDNADSAQSLAVMLGLMGYETLTANDGLAALETAETWNPEVCLLDIGMPELNGYETAERMRNRTWGKKAFLVALTGWGQEDDKRRSIEAGFDIHLIKPVDPAQLAQLLRDRSAKVTR